jgi:hypothetical protein
MLLPLEEVEQFFRLHRAPMFYGRLIRSRYSYLPRFFAGFCLIANGIYLGVGSFSGVGDAGDLLRYGAPRGTLIAFADLITAGFDEGVDRSRTRRE